MNGNQRGKRLEGMNLKGKKNYCKIDKKYLTNTVTAIILIIVNRTIKEGRGCMIH